MIQMKLPDGSAASVDQKVMDLLLDLQNAARNPKQLPKFWHLRSALEAYGAQFLNFYSFVLANGGVSHAQLFQDLFVLFILEGKQGGRFLEFGATDGRSLSNSLLLEQSFGWTGVLAEPSPQWHEALRTNRPATEIITDCIYSASGKTLDFFVSDVGELSTVADFRQADAKAMPGNATARNAKGYTCQVDTISLNDVCAAHFDGAALDYMSVDTEGSELLILSHFDFARFQPKVVTVEHNHAAAEAELDTLFEDNGYVRYFNGYTQFDAWYVRHGVASGD